MLRVKITAGIVVDGPMPFEEFMAACLYDPDGGFFTTGPLRSVKGGDFLTSPEVSQWFGRSLARFVGRLLPCGLVVDVGAGSGSLLRPMMEELGDRYDFHAVEASPAARAALAELLPADRIHESIQGLPARFSGVVVANELVDNLPVALAVHRGAGWEERWVGREGENLVLVAAPCRPEVAAWCDAYGGAVPEGGMVEVQLRAMEWVEAVLLRIEEGALVVFDYGGTAEELEPRRTQGTLRTYRAHHLGPDPLLEPGATDITVDVNFTAIAAACEAAGATVELLRQDDFLTRLGLGEEIARLRDEERTEAGTGDPMQRLRLRSERVDAETLLHPRGLGDFRVLIARK